MQQGFPVKNLFMDGQYKPLHVELASMKIALNV